MTFISSHFHVQQSTRSFRTVSVTKPQPSRDGSYDQADHMNHVGGFDNNSTQTVWLEDLTKQVYIISTYILIFFTLCIMPAYRAAHPNMSSCSSHPAVSWGCGLTSRGTREMKHLSVLSSVECYSAPRQISLPSPPASFATRSSLSEEDWKGRFPRKFQSSKQDQQLRRLFTSQQLPRSWCLCFFFSSFFFWRRMQLCVWLCVQVCGRKGGLVREFIPLCIGV